MSENVLQASFAAGELSPSLFARVDFAKYRSGAATMRNFFVDYRSGASTRTGTEFIRPARYLNKPVRLVRFQQSQSVTFILEFGDQYIRFISQGGSIVESPFSATAITHSLPLTITIPGNNFAAGNMIFVSGIPGVPQIAGRYFNVSSVLGGGNITVADPITGNPVDSTTWGTVTGSGQAQRVFTIASPYAASELPLLKFSQKASQMNITHPNHPPYVLQLFSATNWSLAPAAFGSTVDGPPFQSFTQVTASAGATAVNYKYAVTSVDANNQESTVGFIVVESGWDLRTVVGTNQIVWGVQAGASFYNVYGSSPSYTGFAADTGNLGFIGTVSGGSSTEFQDSNIAPDFSQTPPIFQNPFAGINPQVSSYFQQRLIYANGGGSLVQRFWAGRVGAPYNFNISNPIQANDAITGDLVSLEVNEIKSMIPMPTGLIVLTTKGAWLISGGTGGIASQGGPITPASITATPQAYIGANDVPPILINYDIYYIQSKGSTIRDLTYNIYANIYTGNDVSILSSHLFFTHQVLEWAYAEEPFKVVWCIREDGIALGLTVLKEQDLYGWSRHDTRGSFRSVATVTEGMVDATYFAVERPNPSGTGTAWYIERLADRSFDFGAEDAWCVDAGVATDHFFPSANLTISPVGVNNGVTLTANQPVFSSGSVGSIVRAGGGIIKVTGFTATTVVTGTVIQSITAITPDDPLNRPEVAMNGDWSLDKPFTKVFGLDHLEGQSVSVLADGGVVNGLTVSGGSITLPSPVTKVVAGYGFQAQLQTMYLDLGQEINSIQGKRKKVGALTVRVKDSRGLKAGRTFKLITPLKELNRVTLMGLPVQLITSDERIIMDPLWDVPGQICLQVDDPLPVTVLGVIPEVVIGDTAK